MPRFFVDMPLLVGDVLTLPDEVARHVQVLRLAPGDSLVLFNGRGGQHAARLVEIGRRHALAEVGEFSPIDAEPPYEIALAQGIAGGDKMDWLIEKSVELGAARVVPLSAARSVVRLAAERAQRRQSHWQALVRAACEQCGRNRIPEVEAPQEFGRWLDTLSAEASEGELRLMLSPRGARSLHSLPESPPTGRVTLLVGPEGGLAPEEEAAAGQRGFVALALGPRVLRTETAGMAVLAALAARWGGW
ncbi:16S rRNA (uracil(1498)-N(3))-methyltransferase [Trinickia caryophylli]|uniref:Ribosomal RNA small subunit methyltransferase E n=1 Tax=Trinickia caryophylli TaxID=28094 RepID=A0A1X7CAS7_TRICW|nr:16S rRNA (uracil(1498)-N(3))-methyltransferase [Trinickia caryophylli]PMS12430.1 16S rRNA (uracil(1498)-N(3))-methyltransferase [Trinickia caryophylli]TRX19629.1 16S rRNA (uracil(1498)-N(3))-methyltransferase [Trinickia caryophylli]WQE13057.1 16S rRNA (uracil(1498)-N(3))-methyltransferase [Trinickia caryophylli]SME93074.1 16S rRNA m(3)U-1498 methyltransferase [Trinickia caryophylli]GLU30794.1 ribosomal RNA small subunit methyltransferase E [Trinickia caryophylli]